MFNLLRNIKLSMIADCNHIFAKPTGYSKPDIFTSKRYVCQSPKTCLNDDFPIMPTMWHFVLLVNVVGTYMTFSTTMNNKSRLSLLENNVIKLQRSSKK